MGTLATIGVNDDLSARQTCVTMRPANDELTSGVHVEFDISAKER